MSKILTNPPEAESKPETIYKEKHTSPIATIQQKLNSCHQPLYLLWETMCVNCFSQSLIFLHQKLPPAVYSTTFAWSQCHLLTCPFSAAGDAEELKCTQDTLMSQWYDTEENIHRTQWYMQWCSTHGSKNIHWTHWCRAHCSKTHTDTLM